MTFRWRADGGPFWLLGIGFLREYKPGLGTSTYYTDTGALERIPFPILKYIYIGKVCYQLTGSSDFTFKSLLSVNWQQRIYVKIAATS